MDKRAIRTLIGHPALLIGAALLVTACSGSPWSSAKSEDQPANDQAFEQQTGAIEAVDQSPIADSAEVLPVTTDKIRIRADYPREYVVKKGDTLWGISTKFLKDPWYWPEIWHRNPQVANPHLIYPGDILTLIYVDGVPQIRVTRVSESQDEVIRKDTKAATPSGLKVVKLTPNIHRKSLAASIPTIPSDAVRQFLTRPRVISIEEWENAPYILGSDDAHLILGANNKIYIRGELDKERIRYSVFRKGAKLIDPDTNELLGFEIIYAGQARISGYDQPASGILISTTREVLIGDRLLPTDKSAIDQVYYPRVPEIDLQGKVISLFDAIAGIAKHQIAVINLGSDSGVEVGHLLASYQKGELARDRFLAKKQAKRGEEDKLMVQLPDERSGLLMVFKTFERVSYALVLESTRVIHRLDKVKKP